jgi:hypothetical protein
VAYVFNGNRREVRTANSCSCLAAGHKLFRSFHCFPAGRVTIQACRRQIPRILVRLGRLKGVIYSSDRGGRGMKTYIHFMNTPPMLACDTHGRQLYVLGGRYRVTERGIEG